MVKKKKDENKELEIELEDVNKKEDKKKVDSEDKKEEIKIEKKEKVFKKKAKKENKKEDKKEKAIDPPAIIMDKGVPLRVFISACGRKYDQMAAFEYHAKKKELKPCSIVEWNKRFEEFMKLPV